MVPIPVSGRVFGTIMRPGLADCAPSGRLRLDAVARWLQDVAYADVDDAGVADRAFWILRRTRIRVSRFPQINEQFRVHTFCSGVGRLVAERRTVISPVEDPGQVVIDAVALWVHLDPASQRPTDLTPTELGIFARAGYGERRISHRLRHLRPAPGAGNRLFDWQFRRVDTDVADHVNNAAYWELLEEELLMTGPEDLRRLDAEIEFRDGAQPGPAVYLSDDRGRRHVLDASGGLLATVALLDDPLLVPGG
jgi:acyl-ACP thioesterase